MAKVGKTHPSLEDEAQRAAKQVKVGQKGVKRRNEPQDAPPTWLPAPMLEGDPLLANPSIKDFQGGTAGYVADTVKQALLLPGDITELQSMRRHKVFLNLKRYLAMVRILLYHSSSFLFLFFIAFLSFFS